MNFPLRQTPIVVTPRPSLVVGQKVKFAETRRAWTVRAVTTASRFAILTQPFNLRRTVLYTVVDFDRGIRGRDNYYGLGYESTDDIADALHQFQHTENGTRDCVDEFCRNGAEVSWRAGNHIRLDFQSIDGLACDNLGRTS